VERVLPLLKPGHSLRFAMLPEGKDPDDMVREEGAEAIQAIFDKSSSLPQMLFRLLLANERMEGADDRARLQQKLTKLIENISDPIVRRHYEKELSDWLWQHFAASFGWNRPKANTRSSYSVRREYIAAVSDGNAKLAALDPNQCEKELLAHLLNYPQLLAYDEEILLSVNFENPVYAAIAQELVTIFNTEQIREHEEMLQRLKGRGFDSQITSLGRSVISLVGTAKRGRDPIIAEEGFWAAIHELRRLNRISEIRLDFAKTVDWSNSETIELFDKLRWVAREFGSASDERMAFKLAEDYRAMRKRLPPAGVQLRQAVG